MGDYRRRNIGGFFLDNQLFDLRTALDYLEKNGFSWQEAKEYLLLLPYESEG